MTMTHNLIDKGALLSRVSSLPDLQQRDLLLNRTLAVLKRVDTVSEWHDLAVHELGLHVHPCRRGNPTAVNLMFVSKHPFKRNERESCVTVGWMCMSYQKS